MRWQLSAALAALPAGRRWLRRILRQDATRVDLRRFAPEQAKAPHVQRLPRILEAFLQGFNAMTTAESLPSIRGALNQVEPFYRGFAFEGAGMGFGARCLLRDAEPGGFEAAIRELGPGHLFQYYVGLGWWLYERHRLNRNGYNAWLQHLDPRYRSILFDGVGFRLGFFHLHKDPRVHRKLQALGPDAQAPGYQGYGRALWFCLQGDAPALLAAAHQLPSEHRPDFLSGLGLAAAYSTVDTPRTALSLPKGFPIPDRPALWQGIAFGWEARRRQDPLYFERCLKAGHVNRQLVSTLLGAVEAGYQQADGVEPFYQSWLTRTRLACGNQQQSMEVFRL